MSDRKNSDSAGIKQDLFGTSSSDEGDFNIKPGDLHENPEITYKGKKIYFFELQKINAILRDFFMTIFSFIHKTKKITQFFQIINNNLQNSC